MSKYNYCLATHPDKQNKSANSRGRKYHITVDGKLSLCKNVVTHLIGSKEDVFDEKGMPKHNGLHWSPTQYQQGMCGNCRTIAEQKQMNVKPMEY